MLQTIAQGDDPLLNLGLAQSLGNIPPQLRPALAIALLYQDQRVTASLAANAMAGSPVDSYPQEVRRRFAHALKDYLAAEWFNSERPESVVNLADVHARRGETGKAEELYRSAIRLSPYYTPAYINLADLYRVSGRELQAEELLRSALETAADKAMIQHGLGLSLVRQKKISDAINFFRQAAEGPAATGRYLYVYAIALNSTGKPQQAISVLERGLKTFPQNREILQALISLSQDTGNPEQAEYYRKILSR